MNTWPQLSAPVDPLDNFNIARAMSMLTRDGKVPTYSEAEEYARTQGAPDASYYTSHSYSDLSGGY